MNFSLAWANLIWRILSYFEPVSLSENIGHNPPAITSGFWVRSAVLEWSVFSDIIPTPKSGAAEARGEWWLCRPTLTSVWHYDG